MPLLPGKKRRDLEKIASSIRFSLSRSEFELTERFAGLEKLLFYHPDLATKELHFDFYFPIEELLRSIEDSVRTVIARHLEYLVTGKGKSYLRTGGTPRWHARRLILKPLRHLPPPSYGRIKKRLRYIAVDLLALQDDRIRLEKITRALFDKGYIISREPIPYYKTVDFYELLNMYVNRKFAEDFVQAVLVDLKVIRMHFNRQPQAGHSLRPIAQEKRIARVRKVLSQCLNDFAQKLANEKKRNFVQELLDRDIDETSGRRAVRELARLLERMPFEEAKEIVFAMEFMKKLPDKMLSDQYEIGPGGILRKK